MDMCSIDEARQLLGAEADGLTDAEVAALRDDAYAFAGAVATVARHAVPTAKRGRQPRPRADRRERGERGSA